MSFIPSRRGASFNPPSASISAVLPGAPRFLPPSRHVWLHVAAVPCLLVLLAEVASQTGFDHAVSDYFYDASGARFPAHESFWLELLGHRIAKAAIWMVAIVMLAAALVASRTSLKPDDRRALWIALLAMGLGPLIVFLLKHTTGHHCPWDLKAYGGFADVNWDWFVMPADAGRCFPSGHASAGFSLIALAFLGRAIRLPRLERAGFAAAIVLGIVYSLVRITQGAHFVSHNLWAAAIDWCAAALVFAPLLSRWRT